MPATSVSVNQNPDLPPPNGDPRQAEKYVNQLIQLIETDRTEVLQTDLEKFDPSSLQDHYRLELKDYQVEISHSKHPSSGKDSFVLLFNNIKRVASGNFEKVILAYMHLENDQFARMKKAFLQQLDRKRKFEEEKRLKDALLPIDQVLEELDKNVPTSNGFNYSSESHTVHS